MIFKKLLRDAADWWCVIATVIVLAHLYPKEGVSVYADNETGCEYYMTQWGQNMIPRTDGKGQHLGCKFEEYNHEG